MSNYALLILCFLAGIALRHFRKVPEGSHAALNAFIVYISLPALTLHHVQGMEVDLGLLPAIAMPWLMFVLAMLVFMVLARFLSLDRPTTAVLMLTGGLANTSFMGIPMLESALGAEAVPYAVVIDQLGTYLVLSVLGLMLVGVYAGDRPTVRGVVRRVITFPPFVALLAAVALMPLEYPAWLSGTLSRLGDTIAPLALVSVGMQVSWTAIGHHRVALTLGLLFKLVAAPLIILLLYRPLGWVEGVLGSTIILEAAMAPQIGGAIVAMQNRLNPPLVALMLGIGIPLSFITIPAWSWVLANWT